MLDRMAVGEVAAKHHIRAARRRRARCATRSASPATASTARTPSCITRDRPHTQRRRRPATHGWEIPAAADDKPRALARAPLPIAGAAAARRPAARRARAAAVQRRRRHLGVASRRGRSGLLRQRRRRRSVSSSHEGGGVAALAARRPRVRGARLRVRAQGPAAPLRARRSPAGAGCRSSARPGSACRAQWRNEVGQLRMDAPYCHRDFRRPVVRGPARRGDPRPGGASAAGAFHGFRYEHAPLDVVGWDGTVYPWAFPILNVPAARRAGAPAADVARHVRDARRADLQLRAAPARLPPRRDPVPVPALVGRRATSSSSTARATSRRARASGPGSISHHPAGVIARPAPGRLRRQHRREDDRRARGHARHHAPAARDRRGRAVEDPGYHASFA